MILIALYPSCNLPVTCTEDDNDQKRKFHVCLKTLLPNALYDRTRNDQAHDTDNPGALACGLASANCVAAHECGKYCSQCQCHGAVSYFCWNSFSMPDCAKIAVQIGKAASRLLDCTPKFNTKASSCAYDRQCIVNQCLTQHDSCMQHCLLK